MAPLVRLPAPTRRFALARRFARFLRLSLVAAPLAGAALLPAERAHAVVGGAPQSGGLATQSVMVLNARGGVCSGVVVAPEIVLTAAHCVAGGAEIRLHWRDESGAPVLITPAAKAVHPGYVANAVASRRVSIDLALVRAPSRLPARFTAAALVGGAPPRQGAALTVGGYGVVTPDDPKSSGTFRAASLTVVEPYGPSRILVWAAPPAGRGAGACEGDSGGPLAEGDAIVAVTSWASGKSGATCGAMTQGVLVAPQRSWIDRVLAGWGEAAEWR